MEKAKSKFHPARVLAFALIFALLIGYAPVSVLAADGGPSDLEVTGIFGSANGWGNNTNWIGFTLNRDLELKANDSQADVILYYEYVENNEIRQMRNDSEVAYTKNKSWSGYLNTYDEVNNGDIKYSSGTSNNQTYSDKLPADTVIMSNISSVNSFTDLTAKVKSGDVSNFRVRLIVFDEDGVQAYDGYTNWITYTYNEASNTYTSSPTGLQYDFSSSSVAGYTDPWADLNNLPGAGLSITIEGSNTIYTTIEAAIAAASDGDTILLGDGTYYLDSTLVIGKDITISGGKNAIIKPSASFEPTGYAVDGIANGVNPLIYAREEVTISGITILGPCGGVFDGILGAGNSLTLDSVTVTAIRNDPLSGIQSGRAVVVKSGNATITDCVITDFQKNGIDYCSNGNLTITRTTITGAGAQDTIAQNGIVQRGGSATITGNTISDLSYTADDDSVAIFLLNNAIAYVGGNTISNVDIDFYADDDATIVSIICTVTFESNGGTAVASKTVEYYSEVTAPSDPEKTGYTFWGWYTDEGLTDLYNFSDAVISDMTLYAGWEADHGAYVSGYPDGSFGPDNAITRGEAAQMFYNISKQDPNAPEEVKSLTFTDVETGLWYSDAIEYLANADVISGYPDGTFKPDATITRAEFSAMAVKYARLANVGYTSTFPDVPSSYWAASIICTVKDAGYVSGYPDGNFGPEDDITRAQTVVILNRILGREASDLVSSGLTVPFNDVPSGYWAYWQITEAAVTHAAH